MRRPELISARILPSADDGPISAAKSGPIWRAGSIMSALPSFMAMSRRSLPRLLQERRRMPPDFHERIGTAEPPCADRIGFARLTAMAFRGTDLRPLRDELIAKVAGGTAGAGEGLDLSLITQLLGDKQTGIAIQAEVLAFHQLFRSPCAAEKPKLRVLALAAAIDMGGNTPIEFLLEETGIELKTLYVIPGIELPMPLPDHDVAIVIASDSDECREALRIIDEMAPRWPRPMLNAPRLVCHLDRDKLHRLLQGIVGLDIPATLCARSAQLADVARGKLSP